MNPEYVFFYLEGRDAKLLKADIDTEQVAEDVLAGKGSPYDLVHKAVASAAKGLEVDRQKRRWLADYEDDIKTAGGDGELAYKLYCDGRIDVLAHTLEPEVVDALYEDEPDDDEEDDEEGEETDTP